jgi:hypothetical protein
MNRRKMMEENLRAQAELRADMAERASRYEPLVRERPQSAQPKRSNVVSEENWDAWNAWARTHVQAGTDMLAKVIGEETGKIHQTLLERIVALEGELGALSGRARRMQHNRQETRASLR